VQNPGQIKILNSKNEQAHNCVSSTSRFGAEMGYEVSVVKDAIGDRDVPGATAKQLVDVS
jgi:nicotinamidase-related amidase